MWVCNGPFAYTQAKFLAMQVIFKIMARKGVYLQVLVFAVCRTVWEFSFYRTVNFSAKNGTIKLVFRTIKLVFRCVFFFTSYIEKFNLVLWFTFRLLVKIVVRIKSAQKSSSHNFKAIGKHFSPAPNAFSVGKGYIVAFYL